MTVRLAKKESSIKYKAFCLAVVLFGLKFEILFTEEIEKILSNEEKMSKEIERKSCFSSDKTMI